MRKVILGAMLLAGCHLAGPTSPSAACAVESRYFCLNGAAEPRMGELADSTWEKVAPCVGVKPDSIHDYPIKVVHGITLSATGQMAFWCGSILAGGCFEGTSITIGYDYFIPGDDAVPHELARLAAGLAGKGWHLAWDDPLILRCQAVV